MHKGAILLFLLGLAVGSVALWAGDEAFFSGDETPENSLPTVSDTSVASETQQAPLTASSHHILIMAEDSSMQSVERSEQLSQKILAGIAGQLSVIGHQVYDETAVSYESYEQGRTRRSRDELIDIARHVNRPVDKVIFVLVERDIRPGPVFDRIGVRLNGQIIDTNDGTVTANVDHTPNWTKPRGCISDSDLSCVELALNENPQRWGRELADLINSKLR